MRNKFLFILRIIAQPDLNALYKDERRWRPPLVSKLQEGRQVKTKGAGRMAYGARKGVLKGGEVH